MTRTNNGYGPGVLYTPEDYLCELKISRQRRLLVEGKDDKELFQRLFLQLYADAAGGVVIDTAEQLRDFEPPVGNRDKVEKICELAPQVGHLVGFVDREFREFACDQDLRDERPDQWTQGRLVWSRGHSIENYMFDFECFKEKVREYIPAEHLGGAVDLFREVFQDVVRVACALGLSGHRHPSQNLRMVQASVHWKCLSISGGRLTLVPAAWRQQLAQIRAMPGWVDEVEKQYEKWWPAVLAADYPVVRWLCHGHIGISTIWAAFGRCVYESCSALPAAERERLAGDAMQADKHVRFRAVVEQWTQHALRGQLDCPLVIFEMLGLPAITRPC